ncbi:MAG: hypothetical protein Q9197_003770 [Variospora fuerteventurae]
MGFGAVNAKSLVGLITPSLRLANGTPLQASLKTLYLSVAFSNIWQFIISILYLAYNAVLTAMLVAEEWDSFGKTRKNLRVTAPEGHQRSSYFVSVPLKYGLPIQFLFAALHYTTSRSVFVVYLIRFFSNGEEDIEHRSATAGYSLVRTITLTFSCHFSALFLALALLLILILAGLLGNYRNGTPLASTSSAAISAACHRPSHDAQAFMFQVQWGVVSYNPRTHIGHCSFTTAKDVAGQHSRPVPGCLYR